MPAEQALGIASQDRSSGFATEMDDFADCIINNRPTKVPGEMGLRDVRTMMALYEAAKSGRTVKLA